ncbi:hypothetical protein BD779DRAFT_828747 [Infundibulicybe gibba]|nr:hypothetical protein BD779DRAFT_828747 [Infundibulicybe gibba]
MPCKPAITIHMYTHLLYSFWHRVDICDESNLYLTASILGLHALFTLFQGLSAEYTVLDTGDCIYPHPATQAGVTQRDVDAFHSIPTCSAVSSTRLGGSFIGFCVGIRTYSRPALLSCKPVMTPVRNTVNCVAHLQVTQPTSSMYMELLGLTLNENGQVHRRWHLRSRRNHVFCSSLVQQLARYLRTLACAQCAVQGDQ